MSKLAATFSRGTLRALLLLPLAWAAHAFDIDNTATAVFFDGGNGPLARTSNTVRVTTAAPPQLEFFSNSGFAIPTVVARLGDPLYLEARAPGCNVLPAVVETRTIIVTSAPSGDAEDFIATETGPNTGVFRVPNIMTRNATVGGVTPQNTILEAGKSERLTATLLGCGSAQTITNLLIDPSGVVFNTSNNEPVANAVVELFVGSGGACTATRAAVQRVVAGVIQSAPNSVTTAADGRFEFPLVAPGSYCLRVTPPNGFTFASIVPAEILQTFTSPSRTILGSGTSGGSYGGTFAVTPVSGPVVVDVPVDGSVAPPPAGTLMLEKTAAYQIVEIGDFLDYRIAVRNQTGLPVTNFSITDVLPAGFTYEPGSARFANAKIADAVAAGNARLVFALPGLSASDGVLLLTYRVKIGPGAGAGEATNRAQAIGRVGGISLLSNTAAAKVRVLGGVFTDRAFIVGKVFLDCNRSRVQDSEEIGVPGVRVFMEDGSFAITDAEGKYSFYGVPPRTHVLKIDRATIPRGSEMINLSNRNAGDANSRFVDLKKGEIHKANFAEGSCNRQVQQDVKARRARAETLVDELEREVKARVSSDGKPEAIADVKALPASGVVGTGREQAPVEFFAGLRPANDQPRDASISLPRAQVAPPAGGTPLVDLEKLLIASDNSLAFVELKDGDTLPFAQTNIRVKGADAAQIKLSVNGVEASENRVGKTILMPERNVQGKEYIGVALTPGKNRLLLSQVDSFGNERGRREIAVIAPDALGKLEIVLDAKDAVADGVTPIKVSVRLTDASGVPVTVRTPVTLESSLGRFDIDDLSKVEPGSQTFIEGGTGKFVLLPPSEPGEGVLRATSGALTAEARVFFLPDLRPMIAAGVIEGVLNLRKLNSRAMVPSRQQDGFEQELQQFAREGNDGKRSAAARAALFLKGKVKGEYLLTLGYDSDKETRERLFRDIQPDEFYPVYGDSSMKGFDAQSTSRLYVRVDKQRSYLLYGDFSTNASVEARKLSNYSRSLTGVKDHYENGRLSVNAFASKDSTHQVVDELRAEGISGPYRLSTRNALVNSEKVEIITRDRNQTAIVLKSDSQTRFADYSVDLEPISGTIRLLFKAPVPSLDANLNPIFIRVTYEVDQGGKEFWVAGADAQVKLNDRVEVGATAVTDRNPSDQNELLGVNATVKVGEKTYLTAELARTDRDSLGTGDAARIELKHDGEKLKAQVYAGTTDESFDNPGAWLSQGRTEAGAKATYQVDQKTRLLLEAIHTEDTKLNGERDGILLALERALSDHLRVEIGARHARETLSGTPQVGQQQTTTFSSANEVDSLRLKISLRPAAMSKAMVFGEVEQDIHESDKRVVAVGGEYQIADRAKAYARHEFISSINGAFALNNTQRQNTTIFGLDTDYMKDGHLFSEYRARDAIAGREAEAAVGLRNMWDLGKGVRLNTNFERVHPVAGVDTNRSTALAVGMDYIGADHWKGSARIEVRDGSSSDSLLNTLGAAVKLDRSWTFLGRNTLSITQEEGGGERQQERLQLGMAYRPVDTDVWNALAKIELRHEKDDTQQDLLQNKVALRRSSQILSLHGNYQPRKDLIWSGRIAGRWTQDRSNGLDSKYNAQLVSGRMIMELSKRWDLSIQASSHFSNGFKTQQYGLGVEVGYLLTENLWLAGGFNFSGFQDDELVDGDYTNPGWYARLRYKFDETLFGGADSSINNTLAPKPN